MFPEKALSDVNRRRDFAEHIPRSPAFDGYAAERGGGFRIE
jgi:hypothetical protein